MYQNQFLLLRKNLSEIVLLVLVESFFMHNSAKFNNHSDVIVEHTH